MQAHTQSSPYGGIYTCEGIWMWWLTVRRASGGSTSGLSPERVQVSRDGEDTDLVARGRHDPCVVPRAVPMVEAMVALVLADHMLQVRPCNPNRVATMHTILEPPRCVVPAAVSSDREAVG